MISIDCRTPGRPVKNFWNAIHFHPTDAIEDDWGRRILDAVAADKVADTVRMYAMLEDIVSMDENGVLHYDFTENDVRMDYMVEKGFRLFLSYNFIPPCIASDPSQTSSVNKGKTRYKGKVITISPPKDYALWREICREYTAHIVQRYGEQRVASWYLQCYNEPDNRSFFMADLGKAPEDYLRRAEEYRKLYTAFAEGVRAVSGRLRIGGPSCASSLIFMDAFFTDVKKYGLPLDFIGLHIYGTNFRNINSGEKPICVANNVARMEGYMELLEKHGLEKKPLIVDEWGASANGFFNVEECPPFMMRERSDLAAFFGQMIARFVHRDFPIEQMMICLSGQHEMTQDFSGFRNFFTLNFLKKPIYNAYILMRKLSGVWLPTEYSDGAWEVLACADRDGERIMAAYACEHFDRVPEPLTDTVTLSGISGERRVRVWCIDETHCNPYTLAQRNGWQEPFSAEQLTQLRAEGELVPTEEYTVSADGALKLTLTIRGNGLCLVELLKVSG